MAYIAPREGEMLYCKKAGVPLYKSASTASERLKTNSEYNDHSLRDYEQGEPIGTLIIGQTIYGSDGNQFVKVRYWTWENEPDNAFDSIFGTGIGKSKNVQMFHEGYLNTDDEPEWWVRESWRYADTEHTEQQTKSAEIETSLKQYAGVPAPKTIEKHIDTAGRESWWVSWINGYTVDFDDFIKLPAADKVTLTTRDPKKAVSMSLTAAKDSSTNTSTSFLTPMNMLIGVAVLGLFGMLVFLLTRKR
jgi:hypothetical protein